MEYTLTRLIDSLKSTQKTLNGDVRAELEAALHSQTALPNRKLFMLASEAIDLLHETEQLLESSPLVLADHFLGYQNCKCLCAAVELNIPDLLRKDQKTLEELAEASHANPQRLRQVMRVLYNDGIFAYNAASDSYSNNSTSELLLSDHWTQWRSWVELYGNEFYDMARGIPESCRKEVTRLPSQVNFDTDQSMFSFFAEKGWVPKLHRTLGAGAKAQAPGILEDYPWCDISDQHILDVGGGTGSLVALILREHKNMTGGIYDRYEVIEHAKKNFQSPGGEFEDLAKRVSNDDLITGDFLENVPSSEVYTMKWCLHDWDNRQAMRILSNIRKSIIKGPKSRLIILESVLRDGRASRLSRYADMNMMIAVGGRERTETDWRFLAAQSGWEVRHIYSLRNAWPCALEFVPIWGESVQSSRIASNGQMQSEPNHLTSSGEELCTPSISTEPPALANSSVVTSTMSFLEPWEASRGNPFFRSAPAEGFESVNFKWVEHAVTITDARPNKSAFTLDAHGFAYGNDEADISPTTLGALRANDSDAVKQIYYPQVEAFVKNFTGASSVIIFDHTVRKRRPELDSKENSDGKEQPATIVHCDQSSKGALRRLGQNLSSEEDVSAALRGRVQLVNVWRPLRGPVQDWPLATMDYRSAGDSVFPCDLFRGEFEDRGQTVTVCYGEGQKWYYLNQQTTREVTMIKIWDSREDVEAKLCPHAAFKHPSTPPDALPRESVEVRCFVIYDTQV